MTSLLVEHFDVPETRRDARALGAVADRTGDVLAGRTVWCATALPGARRPAQELGARMGGAGPGVAGAALPLAVGESLVRVAQRLDEMLAGGRVGGVDLGPAEQDLYEQVAGGMEDLVGARVGRDDVVVAHDPVSAVLALAVREHGAHAVWRFRLAGSSPPAARQALEFLQRFTSATDAYVLAWTARDARGDLVERVAAAIPSARVVMAKEFRARARGDEARRMAWRSALAEIVSNDRGERVGGTRQPRPVFAAR
jgi:hypothetical protein